MKNAPKFPPDFLSLYSVGQEKSAKFPPNFPPNFPAKNLTNELLQERRENHLALFEKDSETPTATWSRTK